MRNNLTADSDRPRVDGSESSGVAAPGRLLLVYQMQKVASMSWIAFSRRHLVTAEPVHVHYVAEDSVAFLRAQFEAAGPEQTIRHRLLLRNLVQNGVRVQALLNTVSSRNHRMVLVTGMREPVARSISLLFFLADFYGHTKAGSLGATVHILKTCSEPFSAPGSRSSSPRSPGIPSLAYYASILWLIASGSSASCAPCWISTSWELAFLPGPLVV